MHFCKISKVATFTCYIKLSVGYFVLKLHTHTHTGDIRDLFYIL